MRNPYKLRLAEWMYYPGVNYYVMTMRGICICDTYTEVMDLIAEAQSYANIINK